MGFYKGRHGSFLLLNVGVSGYDTQKCNILAASEGSQAEGKTNSLRLVEKDGKNLGL